MAIRAPERDQSGRARLNRPQYVTLGAAGSPTGRQARYAHGLQGIRQLRRGRPCRTGSEESRSSARELLDEAIARTAKVDPQINAVVVKHYDYAERQIERGLPDGPFTGVPFLLKDLDLLEGTRTTSGATVLKDFVADHSGTLAQRFLDTGVAIFGKSSSPEFGLMPTTESRLHGPTRNPWNLEHSSGGSSGGAAAAVAARILPVAHASDGGGSIRIPASASGVFGIEADPGAQSARPRSRRRLGWLCLRPCRQHQRARQRGHDGRDPRSRAVEPLRGAAAGAAVFAGSRPRSRQAPHRLHRQIAVWRRHRSGNRRGRARDRGPAGGARPSRRGTGAGACRRSGRGHDDHRRRQHRADGAADRAEARPRRDGRTISRY